MSDNAPHHPEARTMVAFIEGRLSADELTSVTAHLRGCRDCRTVVTETAYFDEDERQRAASSAPRRIRAAWWLAAAALLAAIFIAVPLYRLRRPATPIAQLIAVAPRQHRSIEARLSGFPWARLQAPSRGDAI